MKAKARYIGHDNRADQSRKHVGGRRHVRHGGGLDGITLEVDQCDVDHKEKGERQDQNAGARAGGRPTSFVVQEERNARPVGTKRSTRTLSVVPRRLLDKSKISTSDKVKKKIEQSIAERAR